MIMSWTLHNKLYHSDDAYHCMYCKIYYCRSSWWRHIFTWL